MTMYHFDGFDLVEDGDDREQEAVERDYLISDIVGWINRATTDQRYLLAERIVHRFHIRDIEDFDKLIAPKVQR